MRPPRDLLLTGAGAAGTALLWHALRAGRGESWASRWERTNHAGEPVTILEGVALVAGTTGTAALTGPAWASTAVPYAVASLGAGSLGALDDLRQDTDRKGLAGHLSALAHGRVTTGALKILGLVATGLLSATLEEVLAGQGRGVGAEKPTGKRARRGAGGASAGAGERARRGAGGASAGAGERARRGAGGANAGAGECARRGAGGARAGASVLVGGAVVAGSANLANLFDLRPGRALKVGALIAVPLVLSRRGSPAAAVTLGAALALLPEDLAGRSMLGDTGANPLGAMLGLALIEQQGLRGRTISLAILTALTLASEKVSFTRVIEATPILRELDAAGRPPR